MQSSSITIYQHNATESRIIFFVDFRVKRSVECPGLKCLSHSFGFSLQFKSIYSNHCF